MQSPIEEGVAFFRPGFLAGSDELFDRLAADVAWDDRIRARRVASFGVPYNYSGIVWPDTPMPAPLVPVVAAVAAAKSIVRHAAANGFRKFYDQADF